MLKARPHKSLQKYWTYNPVLYQRESQDRLISEDLAQLLVSHFRQRWEHHDNQSDGDWYVRCACLKDIYEGSRARNKVSNAHAYRHRKEYPEREETVQE